MLWITSAAMRRISSRVRSQTWSSFFNGRYGSPAALPISAPFFFETETAWLMFVRRCWSQSFCWWPFLRFPREDAAADYKCGHDCPENPKLHLRHRGVLRRLTPLRAIIGLSAYQVLRNNSGNLAMFAAILRASSREQLDRRECYFQLSEGPKSCSSLCRVSRSDSQYCTNKSGPAKRKSCSTARRQKGLRPLSQACPSAALRIGS